MRASETWDLFKRERDPAGAEQPTTAKSSNVAVASTSEMTPNYSISSLVVAHFIPLYDVHYDTTHLAVKGSRCRVKGDEVTFACS